MVSNGVKISERRFVKFQAKDLNRRISKTSAKIFDTYVKNFFQVISSRPNLKFFLIDLINLKIICWQDRCLILDLDQLESQVRGDRVVQRLEWLLPQQEVLGSMPALTKMLLPSGSLKESKLYNLYKFFDTCCVVQCPKYRNAY